MHAVFTVKTRYIKGRPILNGTTFEIPGGKSLAVVGTSGSGNHPTNINQFIVGITINIDFLLKF